MRAAVLVSMYWQYYGLREEPFGATPDPRFLYCAPTYREAQATLEYGISSGRGFTVLVAQPGMGKTTLLFELLERYSSVARTAFIFLTQCNSREFLRYLMGELGAEPGDDDLAGLQEQFGELLLAEARAGRKVIAVVDEAQNLDVSVLETIRLLSDFETQRAKLLHIILAGQPELAENLASPPLLQLRQRISHLVRLEPLSAAEVSRYLDHRLRLAGYAGPPLFTPEARELIAERSRGIPRVINNLCFNALSLGWERAKKLIDETVVAEVSTELDFEAAARAARQEAQGASPAGKGEGAKAAGKGEGAKADATEAGKPAGLAAWPVLVNAAESPAASGGQPQENRSKEEITLTLKRKPHLVSLPPSAAGGVPLGGSDGPVAEPPVNPPEPAKKEGGASGVDVEALAADCALFGMEAGPRWKRPSVRSTADKFHPAASPATTARRPSPAAGGNGAGALAATVMKSENAAAVAKPVVVPRTQAKSKRTWGQREAAALLAKLAGNPRILYAAAGTCLLLVLLLAWLLSRTAPAAASNETANTPVAVAAPSAPPTTVPSAAPPDTAGSVVLDVVEEPATPGQRSSNARPAVVQRGERNGEKLLYKVDPAYPAAARANGLQGPVVLEATIGTHGFLRHIRVLSGDPLLASSVLDAVQHWRYQVHREHGRAVQTPTRIVVNFQLAARPQK